MAKIRGWAAFCLLWTALPQAVAQINQAAVPPAGIAHLLPPGYEIISLASLSVRSTARVFYVAVLGRRGEDTRRAAGRAPARPLLVLEKRPVGFVQAGRNDTVALRADEGGQCDPFLDGGGVIAVKGRDFTVENGVSCGQHWTDYVTFRFDDRAGRFVFDNERLQSWSMNSSTDPDADALVADGPPDVQRGDRKAPVTLDDWRRPR